MKDVSQYNDEQLITEAESSYANHKQSISQYQEGTPEYWDSLRDNFVVFARELRKRGLGANILRIKLEWRKSNNDHTHS